MAGMAVVLRSDGSRFCTRASIPVISTRLLLKTLTVSALRSISEETTSPSTKTSLMAMKR